MCEEQKGQVIFYECNFKMIYKTGSGQTFKFKELFSIFKPIGLVRSAN